MLTVYGALCKLLEGSPGVFTPPKKVQPEISKAVNSLVRNRLPARDYTRLERFVGTYAADEGVAAMVEDMIDNVKSNQDDWRAGVTYRRRVVGKDEHIVTGVDLAVRLNDTLKKKRYDADRVLADYFPHGI